jgi:hypothetical protein
MSKEYETHPSPPMACSLTGSAMRERFVAWAKLGQRYLRSAESHAAGVTLRYRRAAGVEQELRELVALEAECCGFLSFELEEREHEWVLGVYGPSEAVPLIQQCWGATRALESRR